jgi:hypothetical protein
MTLTYGRTFVGRSIPTAEGYVPAISSIALVKCGSFIENAIESLPALTRARFNTKKSTKPLRARDVASLSIADLTICEDRE